MLNICKTRCKHGFMSYLPNDRYIGQSLELYGEFSDQETGFLEKIVPPGGLMVEVGANFGAHTVPLSKHLGADGLLFALEPQSVIHDILVRNIRDNACDNVTALCVAAGEREGHARLPKVDYEDVVGNFGGMSLEGPADGEEVSVVTIDWLHLDRCDLIKIDVEGLEASVIRGARKTICEFRPLLYVENDREDKSAELIALIQDFGYRLFWHLPPLYDAKNFRGSQLNVFPNTVSVNMLCVPAEWPIESPLIEILTSQDKWQVAARPRERVARAPTEGQKTAAVLRAGVYGDALMASSVIAGLKKQGYHVTVYTEAHGEEVLRHDPHIDRMVWLPREEVTLADIIGYFVGEAHLYDKAVNLVESVERNMLAVANDLQFYHSDEARREIFGGNYLERQHVIAGVPHEPAMHFYPTEDEKTAVGYWVKAHSPLVVIAVSGSTLPKFWPHVGEFALRLADSGIHVALVGDLRDVLVEHPLVHVIGTTWSMREAITLAQLADGVVGPETGLVNAVAYEKVAKVVLLSHSSIRNLTLDWKNTGSLTGNAPCYPCHRNHTAALGFKYCNQDKDTGAALCQAMVSVDDALDALTWALRDSWIPQFINLCDRKVA